MIHMDNKSIHLKSSKLNTLHNDHSADKEAGLGGVAMEPRESVHKIKSRERVNAI